MSANCPSYLSSTLPARKSLISLETGSKYAVKDAHMAHVIKVDLKADLFSYTIDEDKKRYLELLDGKLLLVTNTTAPAAEVVQRYKSLADIEQGFKVLKSDIEIGPVYHRLPQRIRSHALVCFMALILYRVMRMRLATAKRSESWVFRRIVTGHSADRDRCPEVG
jgi:transposase